VNHGRREAVNHERREPARHERRNPHKSSNDRRGRARNSRSNRSQSLPVRPPREFTDEEQLIHFQESINYYKSRLEATQEKINNQNASK